MSDKPVTTYGAFLRGQAQELGFAIARDAAEQASFFRQGKTADVAAWSEAVVGATLGALAREDGAAERVAALAMDLGKRGAPVDEVLRALAITRRHFMRTSMASPAALAGGAEGLARLLDVFDEAADAVGKCAEATARACREDGEARFRSVVSAIQNVVMIIDEDHRIIEWNGEAERIYGWAREEVVGKNYLETFLPEEARPGVAADMIKVLAGQETRGFENPVKSRDGTTHILQWNVGRLLDGQGKAVAVVASGYDITEHKRSYEVFERTEAKLQAIMDNSPTSLFVKDLEGRFTLTNRVFDDFFKSGRGFALGKRDVDILPAEVAAQNRKNDQAALEAGVPVAFEEHIPGPDGVRIFLSSKFPLFDTQGKPYAVGGVASDITELRHAEEERANLQVRIIEAQRETLRELSTPLLPIASGVVLMPLVGGIDEGRAALVLEALLQGVVAHQAEIAILDITGVRTVDTGVAMGLVQAAQAAGLLGAEVVLTGVRPAAARTLVDLGIDMRGIKTLSSLEQGVSHAIGRSRRKR